MAKKITEMFTKRCYWVDWICVFSQKPSATELKGIQDKMKLYLQKYLKGLKTKTRMGLGGANTKVFDEIIEEWDPINLIWGPEQKPEARNKKRPIPVPKNKWIKMLKCEWDQLNSEKELVFNFKAYFEDNGIRTTAETKGTMTPPTPPQPPGTVAP